MGVMILSVVVGLCVYALFSAVPWCVDDETFLDGGYWPDEHDKEEEEKDV